MSDEVVLSVQKLEKTFVVGEQNVQVLRRVDTVVKKGDFFVIFGPSGSGKSTLLHSMLGLEKPTSGKVEIMGKDFYTMTEDDMSEFRKSRIGMVYQQSYWIKSLSVIENVAFPLFLFGQFPSTAMEKARLMLKTVGMEDWSDYAPAELSSGQQQKVSLARALINDPVILVADEPTGNLDSQSGEELMQLLNNLNKKEGRTVIMVTHDLEYLRYANRIIRVVDGLIADEYNQKNIGQLISTVTSKRGTKTAKTTEVKGEISSQHIKADIQKN